MDIDLASIIHAGSELRKVLHEMKDKSLIRDLAFVSDRNLGLIGVACTLALAEKQKIQDTKQLALF